MLWNKIKNDKKFRYTFSGGFGGHLIGEVLELTVFRDYFEKFAEPIYKHVIQNNFEPRGLPHTQPYSWMPFYDTFADPLYSIAHLAGGVLAELPFQAPFIVAGVFGGYYLNKYLSNKNLEKILDGK